MGVLLKGKMTSDMIGSRVRTWSDIVRWKLFTDWLWAAIRSPIGIRSLMKAPVLQMKASISKILLKCRH
jgi:hypothetical protein